MSFLGSSAVFSVVISLRLSRLGDASLRAPKRFPVQIKKSLVWTTVLRLRPLAPCVSLGYGPTPAATGPVRSKVGGTAIRPLDFWRVHAEPDAH